MVDVTRPLDITNRLTTVLPRPVAVWWPVVLALVLAACSGGGGGGGGY
jgi:hypothetical protein